MKNIKSYPKTKKVNLSYAEYGGGWIYMEDISVQIAPTNIVEC